jgi:hypothetical protein
MMGLPGRLLTGGQQKKDTKLTSAVNTTCKKKHLGKYRTDWVAISALVPGLPKLQCRSRWHNSLGSVIDETTARKGMWTKEENGKLKDAVKKRNANDWVAIAALVPGRTKNQCWSRWHTTLDSKKNETAHFSKWTKEEDVKLTDAVKTHNGKDWAAISKLVPSRTKAQCVHRWHNKLACKSDETTARVGRWTKKEDSTLEGAVEKHNGEDWAAISALVPGRTRNQCMGRWHDKLLSKSDETAARSGRWTAS